MAPSLMPSSIPVEMQERQFQDKMQAIRPLKDPLREQAWKRFLDRGLPQRGEEAFQYVRLASLYAFPNLAPPLHSYETLSPQEGFVFVNGRFVPALSRFPKEVVALTWKEALRTYGSLLRTQFLQRLAEEKDPFALLNSALTDASLFLYLPPYTRLTMPLRVLHSFQHAQGTFLSPHISCFLGKGASLTWSVEEETAEALWMNTSLSLSLEEDSQVRLTLISALPEVGGRLETLRVAQKQGSHCQIVCSTQGGECSRLDYKVDLLGAGAEASLAGVWAGKGSQQRHIHGCVAHKAPHTSSLQNFKSALGGEARASFEGKIFVAAEAQKTAAYQKNATLLLSPGATAYAKPNLQIFADDVKASHGATVGQIDPHQLLYLQTRGISYPLAYRLLVAGFFQEITSQLPEAWLASTQNRFAHFMDQVL